MKIIEPKVELWKQEDVYDHIARCARVCYASSKTTNNKFMCNALWSNKHRSMFRHGTVYYIIPEHFEIPYKGNFGINYVLWHDKYYISTNEQCAREYLDTRYEKYRISNEQAEANEVFYKFKLIRYTFCIETGIDITRELNRKSPNNIAEQSTRYVDFIKKIGICFKKAHWMSKCNLYQTILYKFMFKCNEWFYKIARSKYGLNLKPQDARFILPLDTMSKVVYTYTVKEWEEILNLRLFDYTGPAHQDAKNVAVKVYELLSEEGYNIINYKHLK